MESQSSLEFKKLKFSYKSPAADKKPILEIDSFQIMKGEKVFCMDQVDVEKALF